jgi:peptide/nickel transport system substrate-binding protein
VLENSSADKVPPGKSSKKKIVSWFSSKNQSEEEKILAQHEAKRILDKKLVLAVAQKDKNKVPSWQQLKQFRRFLSPREGKLIKSAISVIFLALVILFFNFWFFTLKLVPAHGGEYSEGVVGSPKYINPILAQTNDVDLDISSLVFSGLLKRGQNGLENDLATDYQISPDQKEYTFFLRHGVKWHGSDNELTADDVLFTFDLIKDAEVGSPLAVSFKGINAERVDDYTVKFILKAPFTPFLSTLTFGILPEYLWAGVDSANVKLAELNLKPVGSGPFIFDSLKKDKQGNIKSFTLVSNPDYYSGEPYLDKVTFKFYSDFLSLEQALLNKNIMGLSYLPSENREKIFGEDKSAKGFNLCFLNLPQYSAVFFNSSNNEILKDRNVRQALYQAIDRQLIIQEVLEGEAEVIDSLILKGFVGYYPEIKKYQYSPEEAAKILDNNKWQAIAPNDYISWQREEEKKKNKDNTSSGAETVVDLSDEERLAAIADQQYFRKKDNKILEITLTVVDQPESVAVAKIIQKDWQLIGVRTHLNIIPPEGILREVIKPRNYQALLYSEIIGYDPDPFPFWHSSQRSGSGLNLSLFADKRADNYIEAARQTNDVKIREENYKKFQDTLVEEIPAIFLYSPTYSYVVSDSIRGRIVEKIFMPADRLSDMSQRYIKTKRGW